MQTSTLNPNSLKSTTKNKSTKLKNIMNGLEQVFPMISWPDTVCTRKLLPMQLNLAIVFSKAGRISSKRKIKMLKDKSIT